MRRSADFATAFKGVRGGANRVLVSVATTSAEQQADLHPVKVGFVVPKSVGNSVVRHRVYRQLRHLVRARLDRFDGGLLVAVRALPPAKGSSAAELAADLDAAIAKALRKLARSGRQASAPQAPAGGAASSSTGGDRRLPGPTSREQAPAGRAASSSNQETESVGTEDQ